MTIGEVLSALTEDAKIYREDAYESIIRNSHMNDTDGLEVKPEFIDAILVDFINFIGARRGVDYALYTKDLKKEIFK